jgi:predicted patatin/cPLA2 family phospholipase
MTTPTLTDGARSVRDLIVDRARRKSRPGHRDDPHRLALCVEGGAMRGVVSAGMVAALEQLGLLPVFDYVYGSSAGAINGAFFTAGQAGFGTTIYYENINNKKFIDYRRALSRRPILDLDFLVWNVMKGPKCLDTAAVLRSATKLRAVATSTASGDRRVFGEWTNGDDLLACLRAGASMPVFAGAPYIYRQESYWDALLSEPIPARVAEQDGCTHLMVLLTRPGGTTGPRVSLVERLFVVPRVREVSAALVARYQARAREYIELLERLQSGRGPGGTAVVLPTAPSGPTVAKLEQRRGFLMAGAQAGIQAVLDVFGLSADTIAGIRTPPGHDGQRVFAEMHPELFDAVAVAKQ